MATASVKEVLDMWPMSLSVSILSIRGTVFGRFFVSLRLEGEYESGLDKKHN